MIYLQRNDKNRKEWVLLEVDENANFKRDIVHLICQAPSRNKFNPAKELIEELCTTSDTFEKWFVNMMDAYLESSTNAEIIENNVDTFLKISEEYIDSKKINFNDFAKLEKASKTSIKFLGKDIRAIAITSTALKLYSLFWFDKKLSLPSNIHRNVYEKLLSPCLNEGTTEKIFQLIRSKVFRSNVTDKYMWDMIRVCLLESPESYIMTVFKFLTQNMLISIKISKNPVPFLVSLIDDSIKWLMRTMYIDRILYGEAFGGVDDIYGSSLSKESFLVYCCNDDIAKSANSSMQILEDEFELSETDFINIRDRLDSLTTLFPTMKLLVLPIASKVLEIPYRFLLTCPPKHAMLLGIFMYHLSQNILDEHYPIITSFLPACPRDMEKAFSSTRSSYRLRYVDLVINDPTPIFGFAAKPLKYDILSSICGVLSASKRNLMSCITGRSIGKFSYTDLETDAIKFFTRLYSNQLDDIFLKMREKAYEYF